MPSFHKRGKSWRAFVCCKGVKPLPRTFDTLQEAKAWASRIESDILSGHYINKSIKNPLTNKGVLLTDIFDKYGREVTVKKRGANKELPRLNFLKTQPAFQLPIAEVTPQVIADWRDLRLMSVGGSTVNRDMNLISSVFNMAIKEWGIKLENNPVHMIRRPKNPSSRERRVSEDEQLRLAEVLDWDQKSAPQTNKQWVAFAFFLALATAMRRGEIVSIRWGDIYIDKSYIHLEITKNGDARDVPLSLVAKQLLLLLKPQNKKELLVPLRPDLVTSIFIKACKEAKIKDLHFHDSRREATTQLSKKLSNVLELSAVTGHKDLQTLKRYYRPKAEDLAKKLDG
ncbi:tyrosine-type recombinase/integrase [Commensalibacter communis]|uniref:tyrosine-type recombinase/integrase n=1 Tax=Commensalibacter communis TaxID=2972786 RepID=UPI0022FF573B|nr:site-specific integrase [Commensalibacter communis]CAI3934038.1 Site-specific recombinase XerD (XerD) (PDB:1A0P) [Commensalibacter communis]CAI3944181.1 Site-specific recombinase XerD (XerD) (PDB:1A0P) [Commensalibacter communis]